MAYELNDVSTNNLTCLFVWFHVCWFNISVTANGYIEGTELDGFLAEFVSSVNIMDVGPEVSLFFFFFYIRKCLSM